MLKKYSPQGQLQQDIADAQELTEFLQELKKRAYERKINNKAEKVSQDLYDMILDNIVLPNGRTIYNLFTRSHSVNKITGQYFEDDLAAVIASVVNLANPNKKRVTYKNFSFGSFTGTTDLNLVKEADEEINQEVEQILKTTVEEVEKNKPNFVMGKIDTIVNQNIINFNAEIDIPQKLLNALSNATFSDKSYKSKGWDKNLNKEINLGNTTIHLGNSNPYRAILGTLSSLNYSKTDSQYIYYGGKNIAFDNDNDPPKEDPQEVKLHIYHLRYIYELTGAGIIYKDYGTSFKGGAKFLIYNDPKSMEILCVATSQIVSQLIRSTDFPDNPYGSIGISKTAIRNMSKKQ